MQRLLVVERISRCKECGKTDFEETVVVVVGNVIQTESNQQNLQNKPVSREEKFLRTYLNSYVEQFLVPTFCGSFWKPWKESLGSWWCLVVHRTKILSYYLTRWKLHRVLNFKWIGTITMIWDRRTWLWSWNLSGVVVTKLTKPNKQKRIKKKREKRMRRRRRNNRFQFFLLIM